MSSLQDLVDSAVATGDVPGAVALVASGDRLEVAVAGSATIGGSPMTEDSLFRIASITKPITAAVAMMLVEDGVLGLDDPISRWLPELAAPDVLRSPSSPLHDVVKARRLITVEDLLTFRAGWGFPSDFSLPGVAPLFSELKQGPPEPQAILPPDEWIATLAGIPLLYQPGEAWLYNICSDILGVLLARASGRSLPDLFAERLFEPLQMDDTGFAVPEGAEDRMTSYYRRGEDGDFVLADAPDGDWASVPAFPMGAAGLVSTARDWLAFGRLLLAGGQWEGRRLLSAESVRSMITDHLNDTQREIGALFLEGQGWGYGGAVDIVATEDGSVPGRYGWVGGTGTSAHVIPSTNTVAVLLTQVELGGPTPPALLRRFWVQVAGGQPSAGLRPTR